MPSSDRPAQRSSQNQRAGATEARRRAGARTPASRSRLRRGLRGIGVWSARVALVLLFTLGLALSLVPQGRAALRGALMVPELVTGRQLAPLSVFDEEIRHTRRTVPTRSGPVYLDVYAPVAPPSLIPGTREGVVIIPGVGDNRTRPQVVNLAETLARRGLVAVTMTTPALMGNTLLPDDSDAVVQAVLALRQEPYVGPSRVGIFAISGADAAAVRAAADPRIRDSLAFVVLFGGFYDAETLLRAVGERAVVADGRTHPWQPAPVTLQVLAHTIATTLPPETGDVLTHAADTSTPLTAAQIAALSPPAAAAYHLLAGDEPRRVDANFRALSPEVRALLVELSPKTVAGALHAPIYLLHDRNDIFVPFTESRAFAAMLDQAGHPHEFVELGIFQHAEVRSGLPLDEMVGDGIKLVRILVNLLLPAS